MDRIKRLILYFVGIVLFFIFSNFLIDVGLNSAYTKIDEIEKPNNVLIYQAEATAVNGRIRGVITNKNQEYYEGKYLKIELFSRGDNILGVKYIEIDDIPEEGTPLEILFNIHDVKKYSITVVDNKPEEKEIEDVLQEMLTPEIVFSTMIKLIILF